MTLALFGASAGGCAYGGADPSADPSADPATTTSSGAQATDGTTTDGAAVATNESSATDPNAPQPALGPEDPSTGTGGDTAAFVNENGQPLQVSTQPSAEELGETADQGKEGGEDPGLAQALAENPGQSSAADSVVVNDPEGANVAEQPTDPQKAIEDEANGVTSQSSAALGTARGLSIATEARRIASHTNRSTSYYTLGSTYMNESTYTRRTDCSGLLAYMIPRVQSAGWKVLTSWTGGTRPTAAKIHDYIKSRPNTSSTITSARWMRIKYARNLRPGDVIAWKYPTAGSTTGHVMIVKDYPRRGRYHEWIVPVVDSARSGHANDTRGSSYSGPGAGEIGLYINSEGTPLGYYWSGGKSTTVNKMSIALGRLE